MRYHPTLLLMDEDGLATAASKLTRSHHRAVVSGEALRDYALWLADRVGATGIRSCETEVQRLARSARRRGVHSVALNVLADPGEPAVARERALGLVVTAIHQLPDERVGGEAA